MKLRDNRGKNWLWLENLLIDRDDLDLYEKMVYIVLCRYAGDTVTCYPSVSTIATAAGCSERKTASVLKSLVDKKLIHKVPRSTDEGDLTSNLYTILSADAVVPILAQRENEL